MTIIINPGPRLHKHIGNNVCTTIHKNLIKILTERTKNMPLSLNGSNYKTPNVEKNGVVDVDFSFIGRNCKTATR